MATSDVGKDLVDILGEIKAKDIDITLSKLESLQHSQSVLRTKMSAMEADLTLKNRGLDQLRKLVSGRQLEQSDPVKQSLRKASDEVNAIIEELISLRNTGEFS